MKKQSKEVTEEVECVEEEIPKKSILKSPNKNLIAKNHDLGRRS